MRYGLAVDVSGKAEGMAVVARALNKGDIALAQIAALLLRFPDPPEFAKQALEGSALVSLASELISSGLLKGDWNSDAHPRTGAPPNRGWFAPVPKGPKPTRAGWLNWPSREVNAAIRVIAMKLVLELAEIDPRVRTAALLLDFAVEAIDWLSKEFPKQDLGPSRKLIEDQICAALRSPKTLAELQLRPQDCLLGYERHHVVEHNDANVAKDDAGAVETVEKFGSDAPEDPSNIVWVPRLQHEQITAEYNSNYLDNPNYPITRDVIDAMDFYDQREVGLDALRRAGVLR
ncbi:MAG: hypothetical protein ABR929_08530 [Roseiarcus sp.]